MSNSTSFSVGHNDSNTLFDLDQPFIYISEEFYTKFAYVVNLIVTPVICILGLVGNGLGLGVLWTDSKKQKLSIYKYLCALTFFDLSYLFLGLIRSVPQLIAVYDYHLANFFEEHMKLGTIYLDMVFAHSATALVIVMSMERMMALWKPLQSRITWLALYPGQTILICFFVNAVFLSPYVVTIQVDTFEKQNRTHYFIRLVDGSLSFMKVFRGVRFVIDYMIPAILLVITNTTIPILYARFLKTRRHRLNVNYGEFDTHQTKITSTVLWITVMYFLLSLPNTFIKILAFHNKEYNFDGKYKITFWCLTEISNFLAYVNAANDCLIYILNSTHYRRVCIRMYCKFMFRRGATNVTSDAGTPRESGSGPQRYSRY